MSKPGVMVAAEKRLAHRPLILAACMAASFMAAIEATIIATVMPSIASSLGGFSLFAWVFSSYMLAQASTIPLYGRLADIYGRRKVFYAGAGLFLLGSTLCGFSRSMTQLVLFRVIQGFGAGGVQPIANTIVGDIYSPIERARVQGLLSGVFGVAAVIGPSLGAFIVRYGDWPLVFWINLPAGVAAIAMIALFLPDPAQPRPRHVDYVGSLLLLLTVGSLMLLLIQGTALGAVPLAATLAALVLSGTALGLYERRIAEPMLPFELWRQRVIAVSGAGSLVTGTLMMGVTAYLPAYVQGVMGRETSVTAVILAAMSVVWVLGSTTAGLCLPHTTYHRIATAGALALLGGAAVLVAMTPTRSVVWAGVGAMSIGGGMGFCNTTFTVSAQTAVAWHQRGAATSSTMFLRFLGQSLGAAAFGAVLNLALSDGTSTRSQPLGRLMDPTARAALPPVGLHALTDAVAAAMRHAYLLTACLAMLALLLALAYPAKLGPATQAPRLN